MCNSTQELLRCAATALEQAYAPYSGFRVGAALLTDSGETCTGCNVENASYGLTICAERAAISAAVSAGHQKFGAIAIVADSASSTPYPCGACRQVLAEFAAADLPVYVAVAGGLAEFEELTLGELLPLAFRLNDA